MCSLQHHQVFLTSAHARSCFVPAHTNPARLRTAQQVGVVGTGAAGRWGIPAAGGKAGPCDCAGPAHACCLPGRPWSVRIGTCFRSLILCLSLRFHAVRVAAGPAHSACSNFLEPLPQGTTSFECDLTTIAATGAAAKSYCYIVDMQKEIQVRVSIWVSSHLRRPSDSSVLSHPDSGSQGGINVTFQHGVSGQIVFVSASETLTKAGRVQPNGTDESFHFDRFSANTPAIPNESLSWHTLAGDLILAFILDIVGVLQLDPGPWKADGGAARVRRGAVLAGDGGTRTTK